MEHRTKDGRLICRQAKVDAPIIPVLELPTCLKLRCLMGFWKQAIRHDITLARVMIPFAARLQYESARCAYAEKHRSKDIPERYRTGENPPKGWRLFVEILKLRGGLL